MDNLDNIMINDEDLGLDDVEYFKEFLKFKKSRALLKAREAQSQLALDVDSKAAGAIEIGANPSPPGIDRPKSPISKYEPPLLINPEKEEHKENIADSGWQKSAVKTAAVAVAAAPATPVPVSAATARNDAAIKTAPDNEQVDRTSFDSRERRDSGRDRGRERERDRDRSDRTERNRNIDPRARRFRSRSREREPWRPQRRSRSRSPRIDRLRSPRNDRSRRDSREGRDYRSDLRDQRDQHAHYDPRHNFAVQFEPQYDQNYGYNVAPPPGPAPPQPMATEWDQPSTPALPWGQNIVNVPFHDSPEETARKLAIEKEAMQQKQTFITQQREYMKKREVFINELGLLKNQRRELGSSKQADIQRIVSENLKLQDELNNKIKSVDNVLDMLKGLIGDMPSRQTQEPPTPPHREPEKTEKKKKKKKRSRSRSSSGDDGDGSGSEMQRELPGRSRSRKRSEVEEADPPNFTKNEKVEVEVEFNLVFYDPEVHWCRPCKAFPPTAKEYLLHLHTQSHKDITQDKKLSDLPWHSLSEHKEPVTIKGRETKRCPIKGLQFFEASTAWFCKLCRSWMGDLHCASLHLKSKEHNIKYEDYSSANPKWEAAWLSDRGKAVVSSGKKEDILKRQLEEQLLLQKKHEDELKASLSKAELLMPFTLQTKPAPKVVKEKSKKKDKKKGKKRKHKRSADSGSASSESSSSSSSSSDDEKPKKKKLKKKSKDEPPLKATVPEKSKWEKDDSEEERSRRAPTPELPPHPILEARKVRNYRHSENNRQSQSKSQSQSHSRSHRYSTRPTRAISPPHVPEKHTILIPESTKSVDVPRNGSSSGAGRPLAPEQVQPSASSSRTKGRESPAEDTESQFDKQAQAAAKKKQGQVILPKTKFAFIGRMPFAKRRPDTIEEKQNNARKRDEQDVATPDPTPPPPPMISQKPVPKKEAPLPVLTSKTRLDVAKEILNKSQSFLQQQRQIQEARPIDPVLMEEDMDIDKPERSPPRIELPPPPPTIRPTLPPEVTTNFGKKTMKIPLPKDFQEALSIIYPEAGKPKTPPLPPPPPSARIPSPPSIVLPTRVVTPPPPLPPAMDMMPRAPPAPPVPPTPPTPSPPHSFEMFPSEEASVNRKSIFDDFDEMELLGIDKEDMAAQRF